MTIQEALKRFRKEFGLTQTQVATVLEIPQTSYSRYEVGQFIPRADDIVKLATTFGVTTDYLLGLTCSPRKMPAEVLAYPALIGKLKEWEDEINKIISDYEDR